MAKYPIPVHIAKQEGGGPDKIIYAKARVKELGANAFIVSKASMKKLEAPEPESEIDLGKLADAAFGALKNLRQGIIPRGARGSMLSAMKQALK